MSSPFDLDGRVAIVTGAGGGIGRATAQTLASAGAQVICSDINPSSAAATADSIGPAASVDPVDVTERSSFVDLVTRVVERFGRLDVLVNVAGAVTARGPVEGMTEDDLDLGLAVNLKSLIFGCQAAVTVMGPGGSIINIGSGTVDAAVPELAAYSVPKAAVLQLTRSLAREVGGRGIRVNTVSPGYILTPMTQAHFRGDDGQVDPGRRTLVIDEQTRTIPLGRAGEPSEVANVVLFLASDAASYVTGQTIRVNGGSTMPL